jgi:hypothetical protein
MSLSSLVVRCLRCFGRRCCIAYCLISPDYFMVNYCCKIKLMKMKPTCLIIFLIHRRFQIISFYFIWFCNRMIFASQSKTILFYYICFRFIFLNYDYLFIDLENWLFLSFWETDCDLSCLWCDPSLLSII